MACQFIVWSCDEVLKEFALQIIIALSIIVITGITGIVFQKKIRKFLVKRYLLITDKETGIISIHTRKYDVSPIKELDTEIFNEIKKQINTDEIEKRTIHPKFMMIYSQKLGMQVDVQLEEEPNLETISSENPEIENYNVIVKMDSEIKGASHIDRMEHFINLAEKIQQVIQLRCFPNAKMIRSFMICDILQHPIQHEQESREDQDLQAKVTYTNNYMTITTNAPQNLTKTVKKYVYA